MGMFLIMNDIYLLAQFLLIISTSYSKLYGCPSALTFHVMGIQDTSDYTVYSQTQDVPIANINTFLD